MLEMVRTYSSKAYHCRQGLIWNSQGKKKQGRPKKHLAKESGSSGQKMDYTWRQKKQPRREIIGEPLLMPCAADRGKKNHGWGQYIRSMLRVLDLSIDLNQISA